FGPGFLMVWERLRVPAVNLGLVLMLFLTYRALPNVRVPWWGALPGAIAASVGWAALTAGFSFYLSHFGSYDKTFGSLGTAVVLMGGRIKQGVCAMLATRPVEGGAWGARCSCCSVVVQVACAPHHAQGGGDCVPRGADDLAQALLERARGVRVAPAAATAVGI